MQEEKIVVITGGLGPEREGSLISGAAVAEALNELRFDPKVIDFRSIEDLSEMPADALVFPTTHGWYGEDGKLQSVLDLKGIRYIGSGVTTSAICMHKPSCIRVAESLGLRCPPWTRVRVRAAPEEETKRIVDQLGGQLFLKPSSGGGSLGAAAVDSREQLEAVISRMTPADDYIVSRRITGTDVSVGLLETKDGLICFPMLATFHDAVFYDYEVKHNSALRRHECPAKLPRHTIADLETVSRRVFEALPCVGFARVDFLVDDSGDAWFLEINTLPGMSRGGNFATMAGAHGLSYTELISAILDSHILVEGYRA